MASLHETKGRPEDVSEALRLDSRKNKIMQDEASQDSNRSNVSSDNSSDISGIRKLHAQRKFAAGSRPSSPSVSPVKKLKTTPKKQQFFTTKKAKTEDFLTFLCLRGIEIHFLQTYKL